MARIAFQSQTSCLLLPGRLRSLPPPSMGGFSSLPVGGNFVSILDINAKKESLRIPFSLEVARIELAS
ncbi:MAG: hypothetical protein LBV20_02485 [Treponema sp.]|nr:hypothetical protein [Treponema sp.]